MHCTSIGQHFYSACEFTLNLRDIEWVNEWMTVILFFVCQTSRQTCSEKLDQARTSSCERCSNSRSRPARCLDKHDMVWVSYPVLLFTSQPAVSHVSQVPQTVRLISFIRQVEEKKTRILYDLTVWRLNWKQLTHLAGAIILLRVSHLLITDWETPLCEWHGVCICSEVCCLFFHAARRNRVESKCGCELMTSWTNSILSCSCPRCGFDSGVWGISSDGKHLRLWCVIRTVEIWIPHARLKSGACWQIAGSFNILNLTHSLNVKSVLKTHQRPHLSSVCNFPQTIHTGLRFNRLRWLSKLGWS